MTDQKQKTEHAILPWVGNLYHSQDFCDDWGTIRDESGRVVLIVNIPPLTEVSSREKHRLDGTDPTQPIVDIILAALNTK